MYSKYKSWSSYNIITIEKTGVWKRAAAVGGIESSAGLNSKNHYRPDSRTPE